MSKPFIAKQIDRYGDCARVQIFKIVFGDGNDFSREVLSDYETLSKGATASANREIKKFQNQF